MSPVKNEDINVVRTLSDGVSVGLSKGGKSDFDFVVHFKWGNVGARWRTPTHTHLIVDMYSKRMGNPWLTRRFVDYVLDVLIGHAVPATAFPPDVPPLDDDVVGRFSPLNAFGEYTIEFIITVQGLIAMGERTNYPSGHLQQELWSSFRDGGEIYQVLGIALR